MFHEYRKYFYEAAFEKDLHGPDLNDFKKGYYIPQLIKMVSRPRNQGTASLSHYM
jgi:hypothetical protein